MAQGKLSVMSAANVIMSLKLGFMSSPEGQVPAYSITGLSSCPMPALFALVSIG